MNMTPQKAKNEYEKWKKEMGIAFQSFEDPISEIKKWIKKFKDAKIKTPEEFHTLWNYFWSEYGLIDSVDQLDLLILLLKTYSLKDIKILSETVNDYNIFKGLLDELAKKKVPVIYIQEFVALEFELDNDDDLKYFLEWYDNFTIDELSRFRGMSPDEALEWKNYFPDEKEDDLMWEWWNHIKFTPQESRILIDKGYEDPYTFDDWSKQLLKKELKSLSPTVNYLSYIKKLLEKKKSDLSPKEIWNLLRYYQLHYFNEEKKQIGLHNYDLILLFDDLMNNAITKKEIISRLEESIEEGLDTVLNYWKSRDWKSIELKSGKIRKKTYYFLKNDEK